MRLSLALATITVLLLSSCQTPANPPAAPEVSESAGQDSETVSSAELPEAAACEDFDPAGLTWFELTEGASDTVSSEAGVELRIQRITLPSADAERYNTISEVCPGFQLALTHQGEAVLLSVAEGRYAELGGFQPAGSLTNPPDPGVQGGGPTWGFRDSLVVGDSLFLSDGVLNAADQCVQVAVHRAAVGEVLSGAAAETEVIYRSEPCVSYADDYRAGSPIKTHLGSALAYRASTDELLVSIGDFHLGVSSISQAVAAGIDNIETDYALLRDAESAISAVVAIADPQGQPAARIVSKGLRNSLGLVVDSADRVWLSDHGPYGGDELNLITEGSDYGWPLTSEGRPYDRQDYPDDPNSLPAPWLDIYQAPLEGATGPAFEWTPAIAPTAVVQYPEETGTIEAWAGDLLVSSLRGQTIYKLTIGDEGIVEDRMAIGERLRDMIVSSTGSVMVVTDSAQLLILSSNE